MWIMAMMLLRFLMLMMLEGGPQYVDGKRQKSISMLVSWWCHLKSNIAVGALQGSTHCGVLAAGFGGSGERESAPL